MNELKIAADRERQQLLNSMYRATDQERVQQEIQIENEEFAVKMAVYAREISALDKHARDHENKLKALQDREIELTKAHENKITEIKDKAQEQQNARIAAGIQRMEETFAHGFTEVIMRHQSFASMMSSIGDQILSGIINHAIMSALMMDFGKEKDAAKAARLAFTWGWEHGGPAAPVLAPALGAMAFAAEMAFAEGGLVPGFGNGDVVPAMLTPGEHVASKELTEGLSRMVRDGGAGARETSHVHIHNTYHVSALDSDGMDEVLQRHNDTLVRHVQSAVRRMNH